MVYTSNGNDEEGAKVLVNEGNDKNSVNINDEPIVQLDKTPGKYIKLIGGGYR